MTALKAAAQRIARAGALPTPPADRQLQIEKFATRLARELGAGVVRSAEDWDDFLRRIGVVA